MDVITPLQPINYLVIGHVTKDLYECSYTLGGTVAYAGLTARAIGTKVGIVTSCHPDLPLDELGDIQRVVIPSSMTTTFRNEQNTTGRKQWLLASAETIVNEHVPSVWRSSAIIHLAPVASEVDPFLIFSLKGKFVGITAQGWMRAKGSYNQVILSEWKNSRQLLESASATVIGLEDVAGNENIIEEYAHCAKVLVVTEGADGARVYWNGDLRRFNAPKRKELDPVGAGDIFASAFFIRMYQTQNPWEAARFATALASNSVTRRGLAGVPSITEAKNAQIEVLESV